MCEYISFDLKLKLKSMLEKIKDRRTYLGIYFQIVLKLLLQNQILIPILLHLNMIKT